ncbi:MFS transporter [Celerinatantimonas sp. YJH-8]|uniref:MFS transporter n=1 Tax=Celerinatantimonas sp. YJH-8 TaxID=3228714 RepID=UPI0038C9F24F
MINRQTAATLLVAGTMFMENLDATVISTALPAIAEDFHTLPEYLSVGVAIYLVALTVFIPMSGWLADRYGARRIFSWAIGIFCGASILCALSSNLLTFSIARLLQGTGGAMMVPVGRMVILRHTPKQNMVRAIAILTWPALIAPIVGPVVGGWITVHWGWSWIFLLNVPLGLLALIASLNLLSNHYIPMSHFDFLGFLLSGLGFGFFMVGIEAMSRNDTPRSGAFSFVISGIALLALTSRHFKHCKEPLFNLKPLTIPTFRVSIVGGSLFRIAIASIPFLLPLMFEIGFGFSAVKAGALLLWLFAGNLMIKPATTAIMNRVGFKRLLIGNGILVALGFAIMSLFSPLTPQWFIMLVLFVSGMNRSIQFTAINTISFADIPAAMMRDATTLQSTVLQMNIGTGIALGALSLALSALFFPVIGGKLQIVNFQCALAMMAIIALLGVSDSLFLSSNAGLSVLEKYHSVHL